MASRLVSVRVDDELSDRLNKEMERMQQEVGTGYEIKEPEYIRALLREALEAREARRKKRGKR